MQIIYKITIITSMVLLLTNCASSSSSESQAAQLSSFIGQNIEKAKTSLGKPSQMYDMQNGTLEYIWVERKGGGSSSGYMGVQIASSSSKSCNRVLITNESKQVIAYRLEGKC